MSKIRVAIAGVGNCASSLIQGVEYYRGKESDSYAGLMHPQVGPWGVSDVEFVAAFDVDQRKVGRPLEEAIFAPPNCTRVFQAQIPASGVRVFMGPLLDGVAPHMQDYPEAEAFRPASTEPVDVAETLRTSRAEVLLC
ncbi:inositol-3-phosphate synthase, partial [bacterium CPR1]|nr:inositol-3-phosphate synthase [bacterium CPR1]